MRRPLRGQTWLLLLATALAGWAPAQEAGRIAATEGAADAGLELDAGTDVDAGPARSYPPEASARARRETSPRAETNGHAEAATRAETSGPPPATVLLRGKPVFEIRASHGKAGPSQRARAAGAILEEVVGEPPAPVTATIISGRDGEAMMLRVGARDVFSIEPDDVGESGLSPDVYAQSLTANVEAALTRERHRAAQQRMLQAIAITVFLGLLTFLGLRWLATADLRASRLVETRLSTIHGLRVRGVELLSAETLEGTGFAVLGIGRVALQISILYAFAFVALSQFESTRGLVAPLRRTLTEPFGALLIRVGELVPLALLLFAGTFAVRGALRLSGFLLDRVARGEFQWRWLPRDLAPAIRPLLRGGLVIGSLLLFGPLVGVGGQALLTRLGLLAVGSLAVAAVPALAAAALGTLAIFGRRYRVGEWVGVGRHVGEVIGVGFFDVSLVPVEAGVVHISHLVMLWAPVRHLPGPPLVLCELPVDPRADPETVAAAIEQAFSGRRAPEVRLRAVGAGVATYELRFAVAADSPGGLALALQAINRAGLLAPRGLGSSG